MLRILSYFCIFPSIQYTKNEKEKKKHLSCTSVYELFHHFKRIRITFCPFPLCTLVCNTEAKMAFLHCSVGASKSHLHPCVVSLCIPLNSRCWIQQDGVNKIQDGNIVLVPLSRAFAQCPVFHLLQIWAFSVRYWHCVCASRYQQVKLQRHAEPCLSSIYVPFKRPHFNGWQWQWSPIPESGNESHLVSAESLKGLALSRSDLPLW